MPFNPKNFKDGDQIDDVCRVGFFFKPTHSEKHYLMNLEGERYHTTWAREPSLAISFSVEKVAEAINKVRVRLEDENFGHDDGYDFCGFVEFSDGQIRRYFWG